ncbi:DUF1097 domain-containing protein [Halogeometricum luteum]|uniref:DUF1097 domain-containing protein n=1 Tax=Halogeometricum luteum TaxID=2950537 RepID=A0ABU2G5Q9_9EURY|nr:DUF1097 domain-containing protein [Halogeometricum sp. S3BR5-2]MDS0295493.1 DUF1097 domain-containing protein [Halogeometricum sp. S3BR5-2]
MPEETPRVPLWLAVAITAFVSVPFGTLLGVYSIPVWASFIAWAEYFTFGSSPGQLKWIYGLFPLGAFTMAVFGTVNNYVVDVMGVNLVASSAVLLFVMVAAATYLLTRIPNGMDKSLAYFNGLSMFLVLYFAGIVGGPGTGGGPLVSGDLAWLVNPWIRWVWISLAGVFGGFLGWFNILITFPEVDGEPVEVKPWEWVGIGATVGLCALLWVLYHPWFSVLDGTPTQFLAIVVGIGALILGFGGQAIRKSRVQTA